MENNDKSKTHQSMSELKTADEEVECLLGAIGGDIEFGDDSKPSHFSFSKEVDTQSDLNKYIIEERNREIEHIEDEVIEIAEISQMLNEQAIAQGEPLQNAAESLEDSSINVGHAVMMLDDADKTATRWRKLKAWAVGTMAVVGAGIITMAAISLTNKNSPPSS